jgi:hypothetical protein
MGWPYFSFLEQRMYTSTVRTHRLQQLAERAQGYGFTHYHVTSAPTAPELVVRFYRPTPTGHTNVDGITYDTHFGTPIIDFFNPFHTAKPLPACAQPIRFEQEPTQ